MKTNLAIAVGRAAAVIWFALLRVLAVLVDFRGGAIWFRLAFYR